MNDVTTATKTEHFRKTQLYFPSRHRRVKIKESVDPLFPEQFVPRFPGVRRANGSDEAEDEFVSHALQSYAHMQLPAISAFVLAVLGYFLCLKLFPKLGLLDFPNRYGLKRARLPYPAGIVAVAVFLAVFAVTTPLAMREYGVILAIAILAITAFIDDRTPLPSWFRLLVQVTVAFVVFAAGSRIYTLTSPIGGIVKLDSFLVSAGPLGTLPVMSGIFTIGWLLLTINALNWFDGVTGQVSVISMIGFLMLGFLAYFRNGETDTAEIAFVLAGIAAAGIFFDFPPGKLLLGDTGSMFFGLMLGLLGVYHGGKVATIFLALGIPLLDAAFVITRRLARGRSPFKSGHDHLHHLLLEKGWSPIYIIGLTAAVGTTFGIIALFLNTAQKGIAFVLLFIVILGLTKYASTKAPVNDSSSSAHLKT